VGRGQTGGGKGYNCSAAWRRKTGKEWGEGMLQLQESLITSNSQLSSSKEKEKEKTKKGKTKREEGTRRKKTEKKVNSVAQSKSSLADHSDVESWERKENTNLGEGEHKSIAARCRNGDLGTIRGKVFARLCHWSHLQ